MPAPILPPRFASGREAVRRLSAAINGLADGRSNAVGSVTLTPDSGSTTVLDPRVGPESVLLLMPLTANAAAALAGTWVSARGTGTFTLSHPNNAQDDRSFGYAIQG